VLAIQRQANVQQLQILLPRASDRRVDTSVIPVARFVFQEVFPIWYEFLKSIQ
jgi:hypothetical protein